jgi:hypothetical protein
LRALKREIKMSRERKVKKKYVYGKRKEGKIKKERERKKEEKERKRNDKKDMKWMNHVKDNKVQGRMSHC